MSVVDRRIVAIMLDQSSGTKQCAPHTMDLMEFMLAYHLSPDERERHSCEGRVGEWGWREHELVSLSVSLSLFLSLSRSRSLSLSLSLSLNLPLLSLYSLSLPPSPSPSPSVSPSLFACGMVVPQFL